MNRASVALLAAALVVAACDSGTGSPPPSGQPSPGATVNPPASFGPPPSPTQPPDSTPVVLDPTLLEVLPATIAGNTIEEASDEAAAALQDPSLTTVATAIDAGVAVDGGRTNLVYALVVKLRPGIFTDAYFRQWRDSFDQGACAASGGVAGNAQRSIDDRIVFITSCAAGLHTYHLWLNDDDLLVSASSVGEGGYGEQLMDNLRVPV